MTQAGSLGAEKLSLVGAQRRVGFLPLAPGQVVAVDPDLGENGTLVYSIQPPNKFYSLNSSTGKIRTTHVMLDRENPDPHEAELMRKIVVSVTDCTCPHCPSAGAGPPTHFPLGPLDLPRGCVLMPKSGMTPTSQLRPPQSTLGVEEVGGARPRLLPRGTTGMEGH